MHGDWFAEGMTDITTIVDGYIAAWNETDADRRRALVADAFTDDASYVDPLMTGEGTDGIAAMIGGAQQQFPGHRFELSAGPDAHHDRVRFAWTLVGAENGTRGRRRRRLRDRGRRRPPARRHGLPRARVEDPRDRVGRERGR